MSHGENPIPEQFGIEREYLRYESEDTDTPSDGYEQAGRQLYNLLSQERQERASWVEKKVAWPFFGPSLLLIYFPVLIILILITPLSNAIMSVIYLIAGVPDAPVFGKYPYMLAGGLLVIVLIFIFSAFAARRTEGVIQRWIASNKPQLSLNLCFDGTSGPGSVAITSSGDLDNISASYEELGAPGQLKRGTEKKTTSYADLLDVPAEELTVENLHVAEWIANEESAGRALLFQDENTLTETESTHLPLDRIDRLCRETETKCLIQVLVTPRKGDNKRFLAKKQALDANLPLGDYRRTLIMFLNSVSRKPDKQSEAQTRGTTRHPLQHKYDVSVKTDSSHTFGIRLRAIVYDSQPGHNERAQSIFDTVDSAFDTATNQGIRQSTPSSSAAKRALLEEIVAEKSTQSPQLSNIINPRAWKRKLWPQPSQAIVVDSNRVWKYLMYSTKTGDGADWDHGASPRDQQPTDLPPDEKIDQFRDSSPQKHDP